MDAFSHIMRSLWIASLQMAMSTLTKSVGTAAIVVSAFWVCSVLIAISSRQSLAYWFVLCAAVLPVTFWRGLGFRWWSPAALAVAIGLAASPTDFRIQLGQPGLRVLPVSHGISCEPDTACYGCIVDSKHPRYVIVLSF